MRSIFTSFPRWSDERWEAEERTETVINRGNGEGGGGLRAYIAKKRIASVQISLTGNLRWPTVCEFLTNTTLSQLYKYKYKLHGCLHLHHRVTSGYKLSSYA